jgi:hypothetical protein
MRYLFLTTIFIISCYGVSQDMKSILTEVQKVYFDTKFYSVSSKYILFQGHNTGRIHEIYNGISIKNNSVFYQKIHKTEHLITPEIGIKISNEEKAMLLVKKPSMNDLTINLDKIISTSNQNKTYTKGNYYILEFYFDNTFSEYEKLIIKIYKKNFHISQMDYFYSMDKDFSTSKSHSEYAKPHLRISFYDFKYSPSINEKNFMLESYFTRTKDGYISSEYYPNYEIINQ